MKAIRCGMMMAILTKLPARDKEDDWRLIGTPLLDWRLLNGGRLASYAI